MIDICIRVAPIYEISISFLFLITLSPSPSLLWNHSHHPLAFHIRELEEMNMSITQIMIGNLGVGSAIPLVAEALGMDDDDIKVKSLAETIHRKTEGSHHVILC
jgi:hypothetical protein